MTSMRAIHDATVDISRWQGEFPLPPIDDEARAQARAKPGETLYYADPNLPEGAPIFNNKIVGTRSVDENGEFSGYWINPDFYPQPETAHHMHFTAFFDVVMWRLRAGFIPLSRFTKHFVNTTFLIEIDPDTDQPRYTTDEEGNRVVEIHTSDYNAPDGRIYHNVQGRIIALSLDDPEVVLDINPHTPDGPRYRFWTHHIAEMNRQYVAYLEDFNRRHADPNDPPPS